MFPGGFPILPATVFPSMLAPSNVLTGVSAVDITAAVAVIVWAFGGMIALRIAIAMSRPDRGSAEGDQPVSTTPRDPREGIRDAA